MLTPNDVVVVPTPIPIGAVIDLPLADTASAKDFVFEEIPVPNMAMLALDEGLAAIKFKTSMGISLIII